MEGRCAEAGCPKQRLLIIKKKQRFFTDSGGILRNAIEENTKIATNLYFLTTLWRMHLHCCFFKI